MYLILHTFFQCLLMNYLELEEMGKVIIHFLHYSISDVVSQALSLRKALRKDHICININL